MFLLLGIRKPGLLENKFTFNVFFKRVFYFSVDLAAVFMALVAVPQKKF